ncbi:enoyl-CoA hydratase-related protein [Sphingomonas sp. BIUV-7]|uniref:Enoyl-CoA hydratase-related protein n=1 Tax=Sphingomonas natans TaxID=3063330 RepID=A0ABT8Y811_9SPHN|nr:enoyl-CoA hydratase-related protein [Sphingomonas sp. BIUV-7]MDO6414459.1 enoyl-CoA hydratase-related protein [Sphingomonas sp. BIUV-7]
MPNAAPTQDVVLYEELTPHIALVTLNRPEKRNAVNPALSEALEAIVRRIEADPAIRVAILTSSFDRVFCAGADLQAIAAGQGKGTETAAGGFAGFVYALRKTPWIAEVEGLALGGGFELALACDMIVASESARFGLPEAKRGLLANAGGLHRIGAVLPRNLAHEMIATGEPIDAARAYHFGLVNRVAPPGGTRAAALDLAELVAANAPLAVQYALQGAKMAAAQPEAFGRVIATERFTALRATQDYEEGPRAFLEKRTPVWTGR